jgi:succinate-semialdehyde dehydrogenase/glutarate-semialdehyde dehydrogenase
VPGEEILMNKLPLLRSLAYIGGDWSAAISGETLDVTNPANGERITTVPLMGAGETRQAIDAAAAALPAWRSQPAAGRSALLYRWYQLVLEQREELAYLMTLEQGKPLAEARGEIDYGASFLLWFAEEARRNYGETIPAARPGEHLVVIRQPVGVAAAITPWNFPNSMITRKAGAALAAGCTMVVKPASATPLSALALAELAERAGIPAGVFNVVTGDAAAIAGEMTANPIVRKISFTGSTAVGRRLMADASQHIQRISLELGGNAPFIVFDDADLERAADGAIASKFRNSGQTCVCVNRILVQEGVADRFIGLLAERIDRLKLGNGLEDGVTQAPLIDDRAAERVRAQLNDAIANGATLVRGGGTDPRGVNYFPPTLLSGVEPSMLLCRQEIFGPLAGVIRFQQEEEAIAIANDTPYGLAAYFYSRDIHRCWRVAEALEAGMVGINEGLISNAAAPFGGVKGSGLGREGARQGLEEYLETKYLCMGGA